MENAGGANSSSVRPALAATDNAVGSTSKPTEHVEHIVASPPESRQASKVKDEPRTASRAGSKKSGGEASKDRNGLGLGLDLSGTPHPLAISLSTRLAEYSRRVGGSQPFDADEFFDSTPMVPPAREGSRFLVKAVRVLNSDAFNPLLGACITFSMVLLVVDTDARARDEQTAEWVVTAEMVMGFVYFGELLLRLRLFGWFFFRYLQNMLDLIIVTCDLVLFFMPLLLQGSGSTKALSWVRVFRILRMGRLLRLMFFFPMLRLMLKSLAGAFKVMFFGMILMLVMLFSWSVLAVHFLNDINKELAETGVYEEEECPRCPTAFASVFDSMITLGKHLMAQDGWGEVAVPIMENYPVTCLFFFFSYATVSIAILNLILAVIVDTALEARKCDVHEISKRKEMEHAQATKKLHTLFQDLDTDKNGVLSHAELEAGFECNEEFMDIMASMDITADDLDTVFSIMDEDGTGDINYTEFVDELHKIRSGDAHTLLVFIRCIVQQVRDQCGQLLQREQRKGSAKSSRPLRSPLLDQQ